MNDVRQKMKGDYRLLNPRYQKEEIDQVFKEFKRDELLTDSQYKELLEK